MGLHGPMKCSCCGKEESLTGCVRGPRCGCLTTQQCEACKHCIQHHHRNCTEEFRVLIQSVHNAAEDQVTAIREHYGVNIFEYGEAQ